ncbi:S24 family peptidase [Devosia sp. 2618]|uniref:S24 family peptidase n=1 Tax=Devosia sp. 2618 TaxID=3156454 RepID=UPI0033910DE0
MNIFDKLDRLLAEPNFNQLALSAKLRVAQSSINRWSQRQSEPRGQNRDAIDALYREHFLGGATAPEAIVVPVLTWVSAGAMTRDDLSQEAIGTITVADLPGGDWFALQVVGDSMDRISPPESTIFVNRADKQLISHACYVIDDGEGNATYKRYRTNPPRFEPFSTNPSHEPLYPDNDPTVVGRVGMSQIRM